MVPDDGGLKVAALPEVTLLGDSGRYECGTLAKGYRDKGQ